MAHLFRRSDGSVVWFPEYYKVRGPVLLDPELSPMENAWKVVDICASVWLNKNHVWSEHREDMEDLEQAARLVIMNELRRRVKNGLYDRNFSFYMNVRSCALSKMHHAIIEPWVKHIRERENLLDGDSPVSLAKCDEDFTLFTITSTKPLHRWFTEAERRYQGKYWRDAERPGDRIRLLEKQIDEDYDQHCDDCAEFGLEPFDKSEFIDANYSDEEKALFDSKLYKHNKYMREYTKRKMSDPEFRARKLEYNRQYYANKKKK